MYVQNQDMYVQNQDVYVQNQDMYVQNQAFLFKKQIIVRIIQHSIISLGHIFLGELTQII